MAAHEAPDAVLDRCEADWLRDYARKLVAQMDMVCLPDPSEIADAEPFSIWRWAGAASVILKEMARG